MKIYRSHVYYLPIETAGGASEDHVVDLAFMDAIFVFCHEYRKAMADALPLLRPDNIQVEVKRTSETVEVYLHVSPGVEPQ